MLENVRDSGIIGRVRLEPNGKDIVAIFSGNVQVVGASLVVLEVQRGKLKLGDMLGANEGEAVQLRAGLGVLRQLGHGLAGRVAQHCEWARRLESAPESRGKRMMLCRGVQTAMHDTAPSSPHPTSRKFGAIEKRHIVVSQPACAALTVVGDRWVASHTGLKSGHGGGIAANVKGGMDKSVQRALI